VCFTYGTFFGVWGLRSAGLPTDHTAIERAKEFLLAHQADDGGWGEHAESCRLRKYIATDESQAVMTAWAVLALLECGARETLAVDRALRRLVETQSPRGDWADAHIAGMFNKTSAIHYDNYVAIFPLWALARATRLHSSQA
jgi:squalene cyclase